MLSTFFEFYVKEIPTEKNIPNNCITYDMVILWYLVVLLSPTQEKYMTLSSNFTNIEWILYIFVSFYEYRP